MKEPKDSDDPGPRTIGRSRTELRQLAPLALGTDQLTSQIDLLSVSILFGLLLLSLVFSAIRAAYATVPSSDSPWEKKHRTDGLTFPQKLTLSLLQRAATLVAFLWASRLLWLLQLESSSDVPGKIFFGGLLGWIFLDALVRYLAGRHATVLTPWLTPIVKVALKALAPLTRGFTFLRTKWGVLLPEEIESRAESSDNEDNNEEERDLLRGLATFGQTTARQAMQPRLNITAVDIDLDFHELMDKINKSGYSRIPVYQDTLDSVEGLLYVKDLLPHLHRDEHFGWQKLLRKAYFIPESKRLDDLLHEFQNRRVHMAVVVDEYGGTNGLITLEDIIEEIFGDINDEYDDDEEVNFTRVDDKTFIFEGKVLINDFCKILSLEPDYFDEVRGNSESLGGLLLELYSRLPRTGEQITHREVTFKVQSADKKRIKKVRVLLGQAVQ
ncbi:transporter associated domain-containing protein [Arundinibacter roseus]|nr:transporter associated domain-containing protein [Arundinibacter roseus]